jgi:hypothetical protein
VQASNPHARRARTALAEGLATIVDTADHGSGADFAAILERAHDRLGSDCDSYTGICEDIFDVVRPPAPESAGHPTLNCSGGLSYERHSG